MQTQYSLLDEKIEKRFYVKIRMNAEGRQYSSLAKVVYYKNDMTLKFFVRWQWFFKYREALLRVANPKAYIEYDFGSYDYELPIEVYRTKTRNYLIAAKRKVTEFERKLEQVKRNWSELFPIENHPKYSETIAKLEEYKERRDEYQNKLDNIKQLKK